MKLISMLVAAMAAAIGPAVFGQGGISAAATVVDVGGVPRFAIDGKPMAATAVMPSPAGKPGEAVRQLKAFREAGAHVWMETDDVFAAGRGYVMVHAASAGEKRVNLPMPCNAHEIFGASPDISGATVLVERLGLGETRVWRTSRETR